MKKISTVKAIGISVSVGVLLFSATAFAVTLPGKANNAAQSGQPGSQKVLAQAKLQNAKLKACQARENGIKNRSTSLAKLAKNMQDKFDVIAKRVEDYYTGTVVPSGKTVANYDTLVSDIQTQKTAVQTALTKAQSDFSSFSCTSNDPKGAMTQFRDDMQSVKQALKDYRTSIKNLIVAVHSVTGEEKQANNSNERQTACQGACQRSCGANASCLTDCYAGCRSGQQ